MRIGFRNADVVGITNLITGESYVRASAASALAKLQGSAGADLPTGAWSVDGTGTTATLMLADAARAFTMTVTVDAASQEVSIKAGGRVTGGNLQRILWGVAGFDLASGRFIVPAMGGLSIGAQSFKTSAAFQFSATDPLQHWEAPLSLFQAAKGGVAIYARDEQALYRSLSVSPLANQTADEAFAIDGQGPWSQSTTIAPAEWRIAAYQGGWQAGARIYRDWHNVVSPPVDRQGPRAWANEVSAVIKLHSRPYATPALLDTLAQNVVPAKTLLYLVDWRVDAYDVNYPDYTPQPAVAAFVARAHQLGFHVMLHTDMIGVSSLNADYAALRQFQARGLDLALLGWNWSLPASTTNRYAYINPASSQYRKLFVDRLRAAVAAINPDAIHLDIAGPVNDANGLIEGLNYTQGSLQLHRDLLAAFPTIVLGTEGTNEVISPYGAFAQQLPWRGFDVEATPPVPVSAYVLPNVKPYGHLGQPNPDEKGFLAYYQQYERQAILPLFATNGSSAPDFTGPDFLRYLKVVGAFQQNNLRPDWDADWDDAVMRFRGDAATTLSITDSATLIRGTLRKNGSDTVLYQRIHNTESTSAAGFIPNWPAYSGTTLLGLDPARQFWADGAAPNPSAPHLTGIPAGYRLALGASSLVTPDFAYFTIVPTRAEGFDFLQQFSRSSRGTTYAGVDGSLVNGATAVAGNPVVGGVSRPGMTTEVPYQGVRGGETFFEYEVPVPDAYSATLSFATGLLDNTIGFRAGPMTFKVLVDGATLWQQNVSPGGWQEASVDLTPYGGRTMKIRFVANPGPANDPNFGRATWSALRLGFTSRSTVAGDVVLALPGGAAVIATGGATATAAGGSTTLHDLPVASPMVALTATPRAVAIGQSLVDVPARLSQSSDGELAAPGGPPFAGQIGSASAGGVTKARALNSFTPTNGQTILSWPVRLPSAGSLSLSFSGGLRDDVSARSQGVQLSIRVNGQTLWDYHATLPSAWKYGAVDLTPWAGQDVLVEAITDSLGQNESNWTMWAELTLGGGQPASGAVSVNASGVIAFPAEGAALTLTVSAASDIPWSATTTADWVSVSPASGTGAGTVIVTLAPNPGPARSTALAVGGHLLTITQPGGRSNLANLSLRTKAAAGPQTLIVGLGVAGGAGTKPLLIRGIGPALTQFGAAGAMTDPRIDVLDDTGKIIQSNDNWGGASALSDLFTQLGAFPLPAAGADAALSGTFGRGSYTVQVSAVNGVAGIALAEIYDATPAAAFGDTTPRLVNISARSQVGAGGDILIVGFGINGAASKRLLIRAVGPTLGLFGVSETLENPQLALFNSAGAQLLANDDWGGSATLAQTFTANGAFALPADSKDAVVIARLLPGSYTVQIKGKDSGTGVALVEVYELP